MGDCSEEAVGNALLCAMVDLSGLCTVRQSCDCVRTHSHETSSANSSPVVLGVAVRLRGMLLQGRACGITC